MDQKNSKILARELEPLQMRISEVDAHRSKLVNELKTIEAELKALAGLQSKHDALRQVCTALEKLEESDASDLFWDEFPGIGKPEDVLGRLHRRSLQLQQNLGDRLGRKDKLQTQIRDLSHELNFLHHEVDDAYQREQARQDEFVIEREVQFFPLRTAVMPWSKETESERYFRRSVLIALLISLLFGGIIPLVSIPVPDKVAEVVEIPERLVTLVKPEPVKPEPKPQPPPPAPEEKAEKKSDETKTAKEETKPEVKKAEKTVRKKVQSSGVLAFKESFKNLIAEAPSAHAGSNARVKNKSAVPAGHSMASRSLVAIQATGSSGGISADTVSRNLGQVNGGGNGSGIGAVSFSHVESSVAELTEQVNRPTSDTPLSARSDEEIQIVFDRYKATLYRIYNKELRKDPSLRGNILLRITIEPSGEVSACKVESTDLGSPELVRKIIARVEKFNFGPKDAAKKITILYPIDFLPAG